MLTWVLAPLYHSFRSHQYADEKPASTFLVHSLFPSDVVANVHRPHAQSVPCPSNLLIFTVKLYSKIFLEFEDQTSIASMRGQISKGSTVRRSNAILAVEQGCYCPIFSPVCFAIRRLLLKSLGQWAAGLSSVVVQLWVQDVNQRNMIGRVHRRMQITAVTLRHGQCQARASRAELELIEACHEEGGHCLQEAGKALMHDATMSPYLKGVAFVRCMPWVWC